MENLEQYWEQSFSPIGRKFTEIRPNYQDMGETDSMVAALYWLELEMYNGGFLQFFCNWGYDAYLLAIKGLGAINATYTEQLLIQAYGIIIQSRKSFGSQSDNFIISFCRTLRMD